MGQFQSISIGVLLPLRLRLWLGNRLFRSLGSKTTRVSWRRVIKGPCDPPEIEAMQYVAEHTTVPVPRIFAVHTEKNRFIYIEMAYVPGDTLEMAWAGLSTDQRTTVFADIKQQLSSLRELQPPTQDVVCSAFQNPAYDCRIGFRFFGPMNLDEFHSLARKHLMMEEVEAGLGRDVATTHTSCYRTCFTHADLAPRNIMVQHGRLAAIIDWGFAGWYPEYWEFTKAHYTYFPGEDWKKFLRIALPLYEKELAAEETLWEMLPEPGTRYTATFRDGTEIYHKGSDPSATWLDARAGRQQTDLWDLSLASRH